MNSGPSLPAKKAGDTKCLVRSVAEALAEEPSLEAITLDRARQTLAIATLGPADEGRLDTRITDALRRVQATAGDQR